VRVHFNLFFTVLVAGGISAGLYGFLPISLILTYRISRTIAFVHGGIAALGAIVYWILSLHNDFFPDFIITFSQSSDPRTFGHRPRWDAFPSMLVVVAMGAVLGGVFGFIVMSRRFASLTVLTLTIVSLGAMMGMIGIASLTNVEADVIAQSPFGSGRHQLLPQSLTDHQPLMITNNQIFTFVTVLVLSAVLAVFLTRTHTGLVIRALADDQEAGVWCGVKLRAVGTFVYATSGAIAALAGVLTSVTIGANPADMLIFLLDGLAIAIVGGLRSLPLAFLGALLYGLTDTALTVGFFGEVSLPVHAVILYGLLLSIIVAVARLRRDSFFLLERQSL
jgi:branched-subunit amino acid ABC-type transport system permease component